MSLYAQFHDIDSVIRACCAGESLIHGMQLHGYAIKSGLESDGSLQNSVLKMYTRMGDIEKLVNRFSEMQGIAGLSIETLTLLISAFAKSRDLFQGFVQNGYVKDAINLFHTMQAANVDPGAEILRSILDAYTQLGALQLGFGTHGLGSEALELFGLMLKERIKPNSVTFLSLLSACSHSGRVREGLQSSWRHKIWGIYSTKAFGIEPDNVGYHTLLSNAQAGVGRWDEVEEVRRVMNEKDLKKKPGWSCFEAKGMIHGFVSVDRSHHQVEEIYDILGCLSKMIQESV
uniref:Pentatricopeptide repeat-containing protein n=1 Tax=Fagus sylvatica TaxID=28930 RepID=A0A2N9FPX5_FAGSY